MTVLVLFYLSAAFDTDDHGILLRRLLSQLVLRDASKLFEILSSYLSSAHAYDDDCTQLHMPARPYDGLNKLEAVMGFRTEFLMCVIG